MFDILANEKNMENQQELNKEQFGYQMMLNKQGQKLGLETWKATSYPAQVEMMKEAGLNPALMYGSAGSGGTTQSGSGGSASGSGAPQLSFGSIMDIGMAKSQIELNNAMAGKEDATKNKLNGIDTEEGRQRILSSLKDMELTDQEIKQVSQATGKTIEEIKNLQKGRQVMEKGIEKTDAEIEQIGQLIGKTKEEVKSLIEQRKLTKAQTNNVQQDTELKEAQEKNIKQATQKIIADITNGQIQLDQKDIELAQGEWKIKNEATKQKIEAKLKEAGINLQNKEINRRIMSDILRLIMGIQPTQNVIGY